ncbi:MAG: RNA polymerase factor sigma-54 [Tepidimonas sp.]|uniref:RNA polymerase factor sigma-54 n=1 Tax=Tepidimonas sp. TaxID=2002775 RepID=UPI00259F78E8|nr:RNA polymerase factor sigma-54 [Tepidimonas sp.]MDM7457701.1 RNA polymerase factor sigma-54 [Tepidimonas sp.]
MKPGLALRISQHLILTPQLQQSIRLLQLSTQEMTQEVEQMLADNPFLERADDEAAPADPEGPATAADESSSALDDTDGSWEGLGFDRDGRQADEDEDSAAERARSTERLQDHLHRQALALHLNDDERAALYFLIESLDDDGYLSDSLEELTAALWRQVQAADPAAEQARQEEIASLLRRALGWLQNMEPAGVGARDLAECLRLQLREQPNTPEARAALALCEQPMEWIARRDMRRLAQATGLDEASVRAGLALLTRLEPKPGRRFADAQRHIIVPDVIVTVQGAQFDVQLNPAVLPRLRVSDLYAQALHGQRGGDLQQRLQEARWFIKNLQQRFDTILRVARAIVERQRSFFLHGEVGMRPLVLRDIADELGLHESTISRVTTAKYMATPFGTFELKYFFGSSLGTDAGGNASSTAVRALIKQMIAAEDPRKPLSDGQLADLLKEQGIECARRTVAKYREALRIPNASLRKTL